MKNSGIEEEEIDSELERNAVIALVMSDKALSLSFPYLSPDLFSNYVTKNVAEWCKDFFQKYGKAPKQHIQDIFEEKKDTLDESTYELIEIFLSRLSSVFEDLEDYNEDYAADLVFKHLNIINAQNLTEEIASGLDFKDIEKIKDSISNFRIINRNEFEICDFMTDLWDRAVTFQNEPELFSLKGALHKLIGPIRRKSFYAILSPEKRGKSQLLDHVAKEAARNKKRVLFISAGDMTLEEISERQLLVATKIDARRMHEKRIIYKPVLDCIIGQDGKCPNGVDTGDIVSGFDSKKNPEEILEEFENHIPCSACRKSSDIYDQKNFKPTVWWEKLEVGPFSKEEIDARKEKYLKKWKVLLGKNGFCKYMFFPTKTLTPEVIEDVLKRYKENNTPIDVLIVDYADILSEPARAKRMDDRNKINATWEELRRISQMYDLSLWTATQGNKNTYKFDAEQGDASEDKRKAAHVTCMLALNQKPHEQDQGIVRVSILFLRDGEANRTKEATVLQCFALGEVHISSFISSKSYEAVKKTSSRKKIIGNKEN